VAVGRLALQPVDVRELLDELLGGVALGRKFGAEPAEDFRELGAPRRRQPRHEAGAGRRGLGGGGIRWRRGRHDTRYAPW
jgi:hypothetical protein